MRKLCIYLMYLCAGILAGIMFDKTTDRKIDVGIVTEMQDDLESLGNSSWGEVKRITLQRFDGSKVIIDNDDDLLMLKTNSREIHDQIVVGRVYQIVSNGWDNLVDIHEVTVQTKRH